MKHLCCTAQIVAALALSGCGTVELFGQYDLPEDASVEAAAWPRLVDTPAAPPVGTYTRNVPDPANGARIQTDLAAETVVATEKARILADPVIPEHVKLDLLRKASRKR